MGSQCALALGMMLVVIGLLDVQQAEPPTFRADAYTVSFEVDINRRGFFQRTPRPYSGLKVSDFAVLMDGQRFKVEDVREVRPGHYLISFSPSDEYRDGQAHVISLRFKRWDTPIQKTLTIPESGAAPSPTEAPR